MDCTEYKTKAATARALRRIPEQLTERRANKQIDKLGLGFNLDSRFSTLNLSLSLDSWTGVYGHSGCTSFAYVVDRECAAAAITEWLNRHLTEVLEGAADIIDAENEAARQQYRESLRSELAMLEEAPHV